MTRISTADDATAAANEVVRAELVDVVARLERVGIEELMAPLERAGAATKEEQT